MRLLLGAPELCSNCRTTACAVVGTFAEESGVQRGYLWRNGSFTPVHYPASLDTQAQDGLTKNDHFQHMVQQAKERGFEPELVVFDSWYSGLPNLKLLRRQARLSRASISQWSSSVAIWA